MDKTLRAELRISKGFCVDSQNSCSVQSRLEFNLVGPHLGEAQQMQPELQLLLVGQFDARGLQQRRNVSDTTPSLNW